MMRLDEVATWLSLPDEPAILLTGVSIDSRTLSPGHLFVAIRGERFDGHDHIFDAYQKGASAVLCAAPVPDLPIPQLVMPCPLDALTLIAARHRRRLGCETIAVTGSNGKTTVKEMIAAILPKPSFSTPGNLNNHIGVPLSLLQLMPQHRFAVFELGANHEGEIAHTVAMVRPTVSLINNIGPAHLEGFGSMEGVARAKGEIYQGLMPQGTAVINADDAFSNAWDAFLEDKKVLRFSLRADLKDSKKGWIYVDKLFDKGMGGSSFMVHTPDHAFPIELQVPGKHNVSNALAAISCAFALGIDHQSIQTGLASFSGVKGRLAFRQGHHHAQIIDDTYNANLRSVFAALDVLAACPGRRIFVLGDLGELGEFSNEHHREIGRAAKRLGIDNLMTCGSLSQLSAQAFDSSAMHYSSQEDLVRDLLKLLDQETTVLVKGSRSSAMDQVVAQLVLD